MTQRFSIRKTFWLCISGLLILLSGLPLSAQDSTDQAAPPADPFLDFTPSDEEGEDVDLELVLAVDISFSVDAFEARTQREGYMAALTHPSVLSAIESGFLGKIAVTYVEWADSYYQNQIVDWMVISDEQSAHAFAMRLSEVPINRAYFTSISHAIDHASSLFPKNGYRGTRKVIDISGDGMQNQGRPLADARQAAIDQGIVINGLPILNDRPQPIGVMTPKDMNLDLYFEDKVIGGPGAFLVAAEDFDDFRSAILSKLIREIAAAPATEDTAQGKQPTTFAYQNRSAGE